MIVFTKMKLQGYQEAAIAYQQNLDNLDFIPIHSGLINQSYQVKNIHNKSSFFLQQINKSIFPDIASLQQNYFTIWEDCLQTEHAIRIPHPYRFPNGETYFTDQENQVWRITEFLDETTTYTTAVNIEQLKKAAIAFGNYAKTLSKIDPQKIKPVIPHFHDLSFRWEQFQDALQKGIPERIEECSSIIQELLQRKFYIERFLEMQSAPNKFRIRLLHHDAKIANLLFDKKGETIKAIVDLDTTMPGIFFSDLGDMIRSMAAELGENSNDWTRLQISPLRYKTITEGYLESMNKVLTPEEIAGIHYAGLFMFYMQSIRFASDYLTGDHYYKTERAGQNRDRSKNQLLLLQSLEELLKNEYDFSAH